LSDNIFDNLPELAHPKSASLHDELYRYLATDVELVHNALLWWIEKHAEFPRLSRMALNYLSIPGKTIIFLLVVMLNLLQQPLSMLRGFSARADWSFLMSEIG